jgi:Flp pilus assembly pilin Flp
MKHVRRFLGDNDGPTGVEYAIVLALIAIVCLTCIVVVGSR